MMLKPDDFAAFFNEVHGYKPFPWQDRLLRQIAHEGKWPSVLDLPTGSGKTAAIDIALFHLALEADRTGARRAAVRIAFVVDRRLVVDDAFARAEKLANALAVAQAGSVAARVAGRLKHLSGDGPPLTMHRLRGGVPREGNWARTPAQPTVLCSTVDQVGSRLLFRGYGVSDSMKPVHAGLLGSDCLILLDEAHLAEPFRQTLEWARIYQGEKWRDANAHAAPSGVALLTATPGEQSPDSFSLDDSDKANLILKARLEAPKRAHLVPPEKGRATLGDATESEGEETADEKDLARRITAIVKEVKGALDHFKSAENGALHPAIGVVVNRVARAREVHKRLCKDLAEEIAAKKFAVILMIGPARPLDRDELAEELEPIRTRTWTEGETRALEKPLLLVATQCIEAGVDIDLDALVTEAAALDTLRQRFGRLNRAGRKIEPYAAIVAGKPDVSARQNDPVYGKTIKPTWDYLDQAAKANDGRVDFGIDAMQTLMAQAPFPRGALSPKADAPILLPAHLDLLSQTSPISAADPDIDIDIGQKAAEPFAARRFAVRIAPGLLAKRKPDETPEEHAEALADALSANASARWREVRDVLLVLGLPEDLRRNLERLDWAKKAKVVVDLELYGENEKPRGAVFVAPFGVTPEPGADRRDVEDELGAPNATEDDTAGSMFGVVLTLATHSRDVEEKAKLFAETAGLPGNRIGDLALAGLLHDAGKADRRFQAWLQYGDPAGPDPDKADEVLAKSGRVLPPQARDASGLPPNWRHEAFSVRLAQQHARFADAHDHELVLWLVGVHHGYGRPFFPHADAADSERRVLPSTLDLPRELPSGRGPQSLAFDWNGLDWPSLFARLKARYGVWELARMEAILRLADHRASEEAAAREESQ